MIIKGLSDDQQRISINLKAKRVRASDFSCKGCYFDDLKGCRDCLCLGDERKDKKNIIWVEDKK